jgi:hypothetical protein
MVQCAHDSALDGLKYSWNLFVTYCANDGEAPNFGIRERLLQTVSLRQACKK